MRLQYSLSVARDTCAAVVPAGSIERSNCSSAVYPPPTFKFEIAPLFTPGRPLFTWASATRVASTAKDGKPAADTAASPIPSRNLLRTRPIQNLKDGPCRANPAYQGPFQP